MKRINMMAISAWIILVGCSATRHAVSEYVEERGKRLECVTTLNDSLRREVVMQMVAGLSIEEPLIELIDPEGRTTVRLKARRADFRAETHIIDSLAIGAESEKFESEVDTVTLVATSEVWSESSAPAIPTAKWAAWIVVGLIAMAVHIEKHKKT